MGGGKKRFGSSHNKSTQAIRKALTIHDDLSEFEEFRKEFLPAMRKDLKAGLTPQQLRKKYAQLLQARQIMIGALDKDSGKALAAIKDIQDRNEGRPTEHKQIKHTLENLSDKELDAILLTEFSDQKQKEKH